MKSISVTKARNNLAEILNQVRYQAKQFVIERRGEPVAVLVAPKQLEEKVVKGINPSKTAGKIDLEKSGYSIEEIFEKIKEPYDEKSLFGR